MTDAEMAAALRAKGWVCQDPVGEDVPEPAVGQVWVSAKARVEPRTVVSLVPLRSWGGAPCVRFTTPTRQPHPEWGPDGLRLDTFCAWARKTGARPL